MTDAGESVNIIGAGPGGLTAAIVLRRHGVPVRVYEKSHDVGHRLNGDFQGLENWSSEEDVTGFLRDIGIDINFLCVPQYKGLFYTPGLAPREMKSARPIYYLVKRGDLPDTLDTGLKKQALSLGVEILFNHGVDSFSGRAIVGTGPRGADMIAAGIIFRTEMKDTAVAVLDDDIAPKGYAYLLVSGGYGTMVTVLYGDFRRERECFRRMKAFFFEHFDMDVRDEKKFGSYGNFFISDTQVCDGKIYIGESAGFQDFLWGFGMRHAILSGYLAARSIIDGSDYNSLWKKEIRPMLGVSLVNRYLLEKFGHRAYRYLAKKYTGSDPCRFLMKQYNPSFLKTLLLPLAKRKYKSRVKDLHCNHEDCSCIWCRCEGNVCR